MNTNDKDAIMEELIKNDFYEIGSYERIYPDVPEEKATGIFVLEASVWVNSYNYEFSRATFDIKGLEGNIELDVHSSFYKRFKEESELWEYIEHFLKKFEDKEALHKYVLEKSGFSELGLKLILFNELKDMLPDDATFESFIEGI